MACDNCGDGCCSGCGISVPKGDTGSASVLYIAYATDNIGTGFSLTDGSLPYMAFLAEDPLYTPVVGDFAGLWFSRINSYIYYASADDASGTGFSYPFDNSQVYRGIVVSTTPLTPVAGDFTGKWFQAIGTNGTNASVVLYNDLAQANSGDTGGVMTQFETQDIPANTLVADGDNVTIQVVLQDLSTVFTNPVYGKVTVDADTAAFIAFSFTGQSLVVNITVDRKSSTEYVLSSNQVDTTGATVASNTKVVTGADFTLPISVNVLAYTDGDVGGVVCRKNYAIYNPI
jgi:hypothetical protein